VVQKLNLKQMNVHEADYPNLPRYSSVKATLVARVLLTPIAQKLRQV
jgi:hypothetical protein